MAKQLYPDMDYQEEVYNQLVSDFSGVDFKKSETYNLPANSKRCICPKCGEHSANFFRAKDNNTFLMTCMRGCGLKKTIHELVMDHGKPELQEDWKSKLNRLNFKNYGTAMPIKNAGRPKGSKTNKRCLKINAELKDEIYTRRLRGGIQRHLRGAKPQF